MTTSAPPDEADRYRGTVARVGDGLIGGYAYDALDLSARLVVELLIDGIPVALARAEHDVDELRRAEIGDGRYGYTFAVSLEIQAGGGRAQVVVANSGPILAPPIELCGDLGRDGGPPDRDLGVGGVTWRGGLDIAGWVKATGEATPAVLVCVDGRPVATVPADRWHHRPVTGGARPVRAFAARLPDALADGRTRRVSVTTEDGTPLRGSPVSVVAFPEPLELCAARAFGPDSGAIGERARLFDRLVPRDTPLAGWEAWQRAYPLPSAEDASAGLRLAVALVGDAPDLVQRSLDSLRAEPDLDWVAAVLPSPDRIAFAADQLAQFLRAEGQGSAALLVAAAGTIFLPGAAARMAGALSTSPAAGLAYGDIILGEAEPALPLAFPAFDYERWLEQGYGALVFAMPVARAAESGADSLYRLAVAAFAGRRPPDIVHVPGFAARLAPPDPVRAGHHLAAATLAHLSERGVAARIEPGRGAALPAIRVRRASPAGSVSVVVAIREGGASLQACLDAIHAEQVPSLRDLTLVGHGPPDPDTAAILAASERSGARVWRDPGALNRARRCNRAATAARGDFILFLDDTVEARAPGWLGELLGRAAEPAVAAVGPVLTWPDGVVRHAGLLLGPGFSVHSPFEDRLGDEPGYGDGLRVAGEPGALDGECLLVRRDAYLEAGGMNERHFPLFFHAADLCLRFGAAGRAVVLTPHLDLRCGARAFDGAGEPRLRRVYDREVRLLRARWSDTFEADPAYNPSLTLADGPFQGLACPPRDRTPRLRVVPAPHPLPPGL